MTTNPVLSWVEPSQQSRGIKTIFVGRNGLRAGWRLLIFGALLVTLVGSFLLIRNGGVQGFQEARKHAGEIPHTPLLVGGSEAAAFLLVCLATWIMSKIERRKFSAYGLPFQRVFGKNLLIGVSSGFLAIQGALLIMFLMHGFRITGLALHGSAIASSMLAWALAFVVVGLCEEFLCRGYLQYTLANRIGFWPAALVVAGLFGFGHSFNANETLVGSVSTALFSLLFCLFLRRTGNLWVPVGFHAGWDWGQTFYGVPDSGMLPYHGVCHSAFSGPSWLTGGVAGPEASLLTPIALLTVGVIFSRYYRENRYPADNS